jgi:hypothetical protein
MDEQKQPEETPQAPQPDPVPALAVVTTTRQNITIAVPVGSLKGRGK